MEDNENRKESNEFSEKPQDGVFELSGYYWKNKYEAERSFWEERLKSADTEKESLRKESQHLKSLLDNITLKVKDLEHRFHQDKGLYEQKIEMKIKELEAAQERSGLNEKIKQLEKRNIIMRKGLLPQDVLEDTELRSPSAVIALASQKLMLDLALEKEALNRIIAELKQKLIDKEEEFNSRIDEWTKDKQRLNGVIEKKDTFISSLEKESDEKVKQALKNSEAVKKELKAEIDGDLRESQNTAHVFAIKIQEMIVRMIATGKDFLYHVKMNKQIAREIYNMVAEWQQILGTISHFLDVTDTKEPDFAEERLQNVMDDALGHYLGEIQSRKIIIEKKYDENLPSLKIDRTLLEKAFKAAVENAVEAMGEGGTIRASIYSDLSQSVLIVQISDTGHGLEKENLPHILKPYWTMKPSRQGLGMYHASKIMKIHNGYVSVESDRGITVKFYFNLV